MTATTKKPTFTDYYKKFERFVFIILFIATTIGWISSYVSNKSDIKNALENNTQEIKDLKRDVKKMNDYITSQAELNGKIIQFMEMNKTK